MNEGKDSIDSSSENSAIPLLESDLSFPNSPSLRKPKESSSRYVIGILFAFNICWSLILFYRTIVLSTTELPPEKFDCRKSSIPSPLLNAVDLEPKMRTMSGSIRDDGSIFRQEPSDEVDAAWSRLAFDDYELINVTEADIVASGKDSTTRVRWHDSIDAYPAQIEFPHQIHCLNEIRKEIWGERYFGNLSIMADDAAIARNEYDPQTSDGLYAEDGNRKKLTLKGLRRLHRQHTMHCLHMTLQNIMCNVDVGIITHNWVPGNAHIESPLPRPLADFSTKKMCRNFDAAADWIHRNAIKNGNDNFERLKGSPGVHIFQTNDSYWP